MRTNEDALRSLRRWFGFVLPEPWDVQYVRDENLDRPSAIVQPATPMTNTGSAFVREMRRDFDIFIYPEGKEGDPMYSRTEAEQVASMIDKAMCQGFMIGAVDYSYSMRIPAFDYAGIPWDEALPADARPYDYFPVISWDVETRIDPDDDSLFVVSCGAKLLWRGNGDMRRFRGPLLEDVTVNHAEPLP